MNKKREQELLEKIEFLEGKLELAKECFYFAKTVCNGQQETIELLLKKG